MLLRLCFSCLAFFLSVVSLKIRKRSHALLWRLAQASSAPRIFGAALGLHISDEPIPSVVAAFF
jgi:hypothetical protein